MAKSSISISLCMIAKNEENNVEKCLDSVKDSVDEIIIIDTGSSDKTKEIGKEFKAKVFDFKWIDDFSAARNESIKHATKDWILVLDADEFFDAEAVKAIREFLSNKENEQYEAYSFVQKNYTNNSSIAGFVAEENKHENKTYSGWYGSMIVRLFRNKKNYEFRGTVHELVEHSIEEKKGNIAVTNIPIHHYGNADTETLKKKKLLYLELCKKKARISPNDFTYYELGVLYKENNDNANAIKAFQKSAKLNPKNNLALYELGVIYEKNNDIDNAIKYYTKSLEIKPNSEAFQSLGVCYLKKGMLKEAYRNLTKAMMLNPNKHTIYNNIGAVLERKGDYDMAAQMLEIAIKLNPKNVIGFYNLGVVFDKKGELGKALENYEKAISLNHPKSEEIKKRIKQIRIILASSPKYGYSFKMGG